MTPEWLAWCERHGTLFSLVSEADAALLREWASILTGEGFSPAELDEATTHIAVNGPPAWRRDHLSRLVSRVRERRRAQALAGREQQERGPAPDCLLCGLSGWVVVPSLRALAANRWATAAVCCKCPLGLWLQKHTAAGVLRIDEYEQALPDWRNVMARQEQKQKRELEVLARAERLDRSRGRLPVGQALKRIRERQG